MFFFLLLESVEVASYNVKEKSTYLCFNFQANCPEDFNVGFSSQCVNEVKWLRAMSSYEIKLLCKFLAVPNECDLLSWGTMCFSREFP